MSNGLKLQFYNSDQVDNMKTPYISQHTHYGPTPDQTIADQRQQHCCLSQNFQSTMDHHQETYSNLQMNGNHAQNQHQIDWSAQSAEYLQFDTSVDNQNRQTFVAADCHNQQQAPSADQFYTNSSVDYGSSYQQQQHNHYSNLWHTQVHAGANDACSPAVNNGYHYSGYNYNDNQYHLGQVPLDERHAQLENIRNNTYYYHPASSNGHMQDDKTLGYVNQEAESEISVTPSVEQEAKKSANIPPPCDNLAPTWLSVDTNNTDLCGTGQTNGCVPSSGGDAGACDTCTWPMPSITITSSPSAISNQRSTATRDCRSEIIKTRRQESQTSARGPTTPDTPTAKRSISKSSNAAQPLAVSFDDAGRGQQSSTLENLAAMRRRNQCHVCGRNYARPSTLKTHLRTHTNERPFKCNVCLKTFSQAANLTAHQRVHTGERPFSCPICGRQFSQSSSVITHLRTHSGERPYRCINCERTFSDSSTLTKHCRIHSGEKPYQCEYCPLNFSQSGNLSRHLKLHLISGSSNGSSSTSTSTTNQQSANHHQTTSGGPPQSTTLSSSSILANYQPAHGSSSSRSGSSTSSSSLCSSTGEISFGAVNQHSR